MNSEPQAAFNRRHQSLAKSQIEACLPNNSTMKNLFIFFATKRTLILIQVLSQPEGDETECNIGFQVLSHIAFDFALVAIPDAL